MKQILFILLSLIILQNTSFAIEKEDLITFHPPQTEAEKALDEILMMRLGKCKICKNIDHTSKDFDEYITREITNAQNSLECKKYKDLSCTWNAGIDIVTLTNDNPDYTKPDFFVYYTKKLKNDQKNKASLYVKGLFHHNAKNLIMPEKYLTSLYEDSLINYIMIKDDKKWKIDGLCSNYVMVNHNYCKSVFRIILY
jgi:hypothetical protein